VVGAYVGDQFGQANLDKWEVMLLRLWDHVRS
jgi:hypothetical protein